MCTCGGERKEDEEGGRRGRRRRILVECMQGTRGWGGGHLRLATHIRQLI